MKAITNRVYVLESTKGAYCYLVMAEEMVLIDTGLGFMGKAIIKELGVHQIQLTDIKHIILTHYDLDHIGNVGILQEMTGATVWAGGKDIPYIMGEKHRPSFKKYMSMVIRPQKPNNIQALNEKEEICGIKVIHTPGHTPGHVCLIFEDVLFTGDLVEEKNERLVPYPKNWNWDTAILLQSIEKIRDYSFKWVCVAHGNPIKRRDI